MTEHISPKYLMKLINEVEQAVWSEFSSYKNVAYYITKWHRTDDFNWENFHIATKQNGDIDLQRTLHGMDGEILLKIAIDVGVETPNFIPSVPVFKNDLKAQHQTAFESFEKALKQIEEHPDLAIGLANSTLESILKEILQDPRIGVIYDKTKTLYSLTVDVLKAFQMYPSHSLPKEIKAIGSSLLNVNQNIEALRSEKTIFHGKTSADYVVNDSLYSYFVINAISTVGLFLNSFYKYRFSILSATQATPIDDDLPF